MPEVSLADTDGRLEFHSPHSSKGGQSDYAMGRQEAGGWGDRVASPQVPFNLLPGLQPSVPKATSSSTRLKAQGSQILPESSIRCLYSNPLRTLILPEEFPFLGVSSYDGAGGINITL